MPVIDFHFERLRDPSHEWCYPLARLETMFADAGLKVEHSETLRKEIELEPWADRVGASEDTKAKLRQWLMDAPPEPRKHWTPHMDGEKIFSSTEAIVIGRKE